MAMISTGCEELDEALEGGLPAGQITSIYSSLAESPIRRRLLCSIAEANNSVFVDSSTEPVRPRRGAVWTSDVRSTLRTLLSGAGGASVVVVDPVEFNDVADDGGRPAQIIQKNMQVYYKLCSDQGIALVLGWTRVNRLPVGANFTSSCIIRVQDEFTLNVEKRKDNPPNGTVRINRLWHPSSNFDSTKSRFDINIDID